jgi:hypothetical protein
MSGSPIHTFVTPAKSITIRDMLVLAGTETWRIIRAGAVGISDAIYSRGVAVDRARIQRLFEQRHRRWD